jgi:hypothetical protein
LKKIIAILFLCCFSVILTVETFSHVLDQIDGMELYESESEESEKDLEDSKTPYLVSFEKNKTLSIEGSLKNRPLQCFLKKDKEHGEINTPPPELGLV